MKTFKDAKFPNDRIIVSFVGRTIHYDGRPAVCELCYIDLELDSSDNSKPVFINLDKETSRAMGEYLIKLSEEMT